MALFPPYQADPAAVYEAAADTEAKVKPLASLRGALKSQHAQALAATEGTLSAAERCARTGHPGPRVCLAERRVRGWLHPPVG